MFESESRHKLYGLARLKQTSHCTCEKLHLTDQKLLIAYVSCLAVSVVLPDVVVVVVVVRYQNPWIMFKRYICRRIEFIWIVDCYSRFVWMP